MSLALFGWGASPLAAQCVSNPIVCENEIPGDGNWDISGAGDTTIQGFATNISVNVGDTVYFKVSTTASSYTLKVYRMGYYGGQGARQVAMFAPSVPLPQTQPACLTDSSTFLMDCGNWAISASWQVPTTAVSGIYFVDLVRTDNGGTSQIFFVVRNDASHSDILVQASDETWQAYNPYGGHSLYGTNVFDLPNRAYKVSFNRPFQTRNLEAATWLFSAEYPMVRWLEANGYDVTYFTGTDADRSGSLITNHKVFLSSGHDEYWSSGHRANVQAAQNAGVNMAFFSGNEVFWKTRWENSIDGTNTPYRTLVCYKETLAGTPSGGIMDPLDPPTWTGTWADPRYSPPADGGKPQNALTGTLFTVNGPAPDNTNLSIKVPAAYGLLRFWRNTSVATLPAGQTAVMPPGTLGYEWDSDVDNGARPPGLFDLASATYTLTTDLLLDYGATYGAGTATHSATFYKSPSGSLVFGSGTVQWAWGLDSNHDGGDAAPDPRMQQATVNVLADLGVQPETLQPGLVYASASTDKSPPTSTITSPAANAVFQQGLPVSITGTATDSGGGAVAGVEVSFDSGQTWHPASGRATWSYTWTPAAPTTANVMSRAVDDSGNLETPSPGVPVSVTKAPLFEDHSASGDAASAGTTVSATSFSTVSSNELLLALVNGDYLTGANTTVKSISGGGLTWVLVLRANTRSGTSEIWRAFAPTPLSNITVTATLSQSVIGSITVMGFEGVDPSGTNGSGAIGATKAASSAGGAPTATLVTTRANSLVLGVGNDYDNAIARTPGAGQSLVHQYLTPSGDTYWVQMQTGLVPVSGTSITLNDTTPTTDQYNFGIVEVLAAPVTGPTWSASGSVSPSATGAGTTLTLSGASSGTAVADGSGNYSFANLPNGSYTITPSKSGYTFSPTAQPVTISGANVTGVAFTIAAIPTYSITGTISPVPPGAGAKVTLSGASSGTTTADSGGNFSFAGLANGSYTVTPSASGYTFSPVSAAVTVGNANVTGVAFTIAAIPTYSITGSVTPVPAGVGTTLTLSGASSGTTTSDGSGNYSFAGLVNGSYTITPSKSGYTFSPTSQAATISGSNIAASSFTATASTVGTLAVDATISADSSSKSTTVKTAAFSTTAGNELILALVSTDYLSGTNTTVTGITGGGLTWSLVLRSNTQSGSSEIWRTFATAPLTAATVTATLSQSVLSSITVVSFTGVDTSGTNGSGAIGATKSANAKTGAPTDTLVTTRNNSWVFGVGNDYDNAIARTPASGQSLVHQFLTPDGDTYWVQKVSSTTPVSGTSVTFQDTAPTGDRYNLAICEILPHP